MGAKSGTVVYTGRAFEQDALQAMRGDVVRALVELITNADDAYGDLDGSIRVTVDRGSDECRISVSDQAKGLNGDELVACFTELGAQTARFFDEGDSRGLFGRGAKDTAAFGKTTFEAIKDDAYSQLVLHKTGTWTRSDEEPADAHRKRLGLLDDADGLTATMTLPRNRTPKAAVLEERLARTAALRDITAARQVLLVENEGTKPAHVRQLAYQPPPATPILEKELPIEGYDRTVRLVVNRLESRRDEAVSDESDHGLLVKTGTSIVSNTLFDIDKGHREARRLTGYVLCPQVNDLVRAFEDARLNDEDSPADNPVPLLRRDRDGLEKEHPFAVALREAVVSELLPIVQILESERPPRVEGAGLRGDLARLERILAREIKRDLDEIESPSPTRTSGELEVPPLALIPPRVKLRPGHQHTVSVVAREPVEQAEPSVAVEGDEPLVAIEEVRSFAPHPRLEGARIAQIVMSGVAVGDQDVFVTVGEHTATAHITVSDESKPEDNPPAELEFASPKMTATRGKPRSVLLRAPLDLADELKSGVEVTSGATALLVPDGPIGLEFDHDRGYLIGRARIEPKVSGESVVLTAASAGHTAHAEVRIVDPRDPLGLALDVHVADQRAFVARADVEEREDSIHVKVFGRHAALKDLLGRYEDGAGFANECEPTVRLVLSEIIAGSLAEWVVEREAGRYPERFTDAGATLAARLRKVNRYLPLTQRALASPGVQDRT